MACRVEMGVGGGSVGAASSMLEAAGTGAAEVVSSEISTAEGITRGLTLDLTGRASDVAETRKPSYLLALALLRSVIEHSGTTDFPYLEMTKGGSISMSDAGAT
mgnify:CR=1 FL=1